MGVCSVPKIPNQPKPAVNHVRACPWEMMGTCQVMMWACWRVSWAKSICSSVYACLPIRIIYILYIYTIYIIYILYIYYIYIYIYMCAYAALQFFIHVFKFLHFRTRSKNHAVKPPWNALGTAMLRNLSRFSPEWVTAESMFFFASLDGWNSHPILRSLRKIHGWLVFFRPTPLKNDGLSNSWDDDIPNMMGKINFMFQTTNQMENFSFPDSVQWILGMHLMHPNPPWLLPGATRSWCLGTGRYM